jgi:hypothetical protein
VAKPAVSPAGLDSAALTAAADAALPVAEKAPESKPSFDYAGAAKEASKAAYRRTAVLASRTAVLGSRVAAVVHGYWMTRVTPMRRFCFGSFGGLLVVHFLVGSLEFEPLGAAAMWVNLLSLVTLISAMLVYVYLCRALRSASGAAATAAALVMGWWALFFGSEVVLGWFVVPGIHGFAGDVALFRAQAPWIWMTYPVLLVAGVAGCVTFLIRGNRHEPASSSGNETTADSYGMTRS